MKEMLVNAATISVGLVAGCFVYQYMNDIPDWDAARQAAFYQVWGIGTLVLFTALRNFSKSL